MEGGRKERRGKGKRGGGWGMGEGFYLAIYRLGQAISVIRQRRPMYKLDVIRQARIYRMQPAVPCIRIIHTERYFRNFIKSNRNQIEFPIFRLIWNQTDVRLVSNQSENSKCHLISV